MYRLLKTPRVLTFSKRFLRKSERSSATFEDDLKFFLARMKDESDKTTEPKIEKGDDKNLPPPLEIKSIPVNKIQMYAHKLFKEVSRYGEEELKNVMKQIKELFNYINEVPPRKEFNNIMRGKISFIDTLLMEEVKKDPFVYATSIFAKNCCDRASLQLRNIDCYDPFPLRRDLLRKTVMMSNYYEKEFRKTFVTKETKEKAKDCIVLHPSIHATIEKMIEEKKLKFFDEVFDEFELLYMEYFNICRAEVYSSEKLSEEKKQIIVKYFGPQISKSAENIQFVYKIDSVLKSGIKVISNAGKTWDFSYSAAITKAKNDVYGGKNKTDEIKIIGGWNN